MAWVKIPKENHPLFYAAVPSGVLTKNMFGGVAGIVNGHMFGGLFARSFVAKLSEADQQEALALDGAVPFDPMGKGVLMKDTIFFPESVMDEPGEMKSWLQRAYDYTSTLPPKAKKAKKPAAKKPPAKTAAAKKKPAKKKPAKKKPAKKKR
jgi:TfoX/Sxy family transcriptional regulator of competence genes